MFKIVAPLLALRLVAEPTPVASQDRPVALVGGTIFPAPGAHPIPDGVLLFLGGRITAVL